MKKFLICFTGIYLLTILTGCGRNVGLTNNIGSENGSVEMENTSTDRNGTGLDVTDNYITTTSEVTELERGFSAVRYEGDYSFDRFLEQGGAESDQDVLRFLTENIFGKDYGLQMGGDTFGCSTISVKNTDGGYLFGRNFDWQTCDALVITAYPKNGYASVSTVNLDFVRRGAGFASYFMSDEIMSTAALYAPLDGMNEKGLCVSVNMIQDSATIRQNTDKPDITTTTAIRLMLDKAATTEEALALLQQYDMHASMNYMVHFAIADNEGSSAAVEYIDDEMIVIETPILTNFYLAEGEKNGVGTQQSHTRFEILTKTLEEKPEMSISQVRDTLDSVSKDNFNEYESTEWSIVFDQSELTAVYYHRENYETGYSFML